jgi:hypothetical protein
MLFMNINLIDIIPVKQRETSIEYMRNFFLY